MTHRRWCKKKWKNKSSSRVRWNLISAREECETMEATEGGGSISDFNFADNEIVLLWFLSLTLFSFYIAKQFLRSHLMRIVTLCPLRRENCNFSRDWSCIFEMSTQADTCVSKYKRRCSYSKFQIHDGSSVDRKTFDVPW